MTDRTPLGENSFNSKLFVKKNTLLYERTVPLILIVWRVYKEFYLKT